MKAWFRPDKEQRKHIAGLFDKAAISFIGVVGYNALVAQRWVVFGVAIAIFVLAEAAIVWFIKEQSNETK